MINLQDFKKECFDLFVIEKKRLTIPYDKSEEHLWGNVMRLGTQYIKDHKKDFLEDSWASDILAFSQELPKVSVEERRRLEYEYAINYFTKRIGGPISYNERYIEEVISMTSALLESLVEFCTNNRFVFFKDRFAHMKISCESGDLLLRMDDTISRVKSFLGASSAAYISQLKTMLNTSLCYLSRIIIARVVIEISSNMLYFVDELHVLSEGINSRTLDEINSSLREFSEKISNKMLYGNKDQGSPCPVNIITCLKRAEEILKKADIKEGLLPKPHNVLGHPHHLH